MQFFRISTLVDITRTQIYKDPTDSLEKRQQDNFTTIHQTLELRGNVYFSQDPWIEFQEWNGKSEKTWIWEIYIEQDDIFLFDEDPCFFIKTDLNYIPFNIECEESAIFKNLYFSTKISPINTIVEVINK